MINISKKESDDLVHLFDELNNCQAEYDKLKNSGIKTERMEELELRIIEIEKEITRITKD